jgi:hypothetical protein
VIHEYYDSTRATSWTTYTFAPTETNTNYIVWRDPYPEDDSPVGRANRALRRLHAAIENLTKKFLVSLERTRQAIKEREQLLFRAARRGVPTAPLLGAHPQKYDDSYVRPLFKPRVCGLSSAYRGRIPTV